MNILMCLNYFTPHVSGLTRYAELVARGLAEDNQVTVLTGQHDRQLPQRESDGEVTIIRTKLWFSLHKGYVSPQLLTEFYRLARDVDVVYLHLPLAEAWLVVSLLPKATPLVVSFHCWPQVTGGVVDRLALGFAKAGMTRCFQRASNIIVNSVDYAESLPALAKFFDKLIQIPPPSTEFQSPIKPRLRCEQSGNVRVGFLGRFATEKGISVLLQAVPEVIARNPRTRFVFAGDYRRVRGGASYDRSKEQRAALDSHIELAGALDESEICSFLDSLDLLVLPSINSYESFGMVQVEAMKRGVPVVASDLPGVRVPVQLTGQGRLAVPGDAGSLAQAILSQLRTPSCRAETAKRAVEHFGNEQLMTRFKQAIKIAT